jgi:hypothetical protein
MNELRFRGKPGAIAMAAELPGERRQAASIQLFPGQEMPICLA